jgi:DtxR family manganese transport transcriptional regulator
MPLEPRSDSFSKTRREHSMEIFEDYVEAIADLIAECGEARVVELAKRLGVTHVTVTRTVERLQKAGYVDSLPYRAIFLTHSGKALAEFCKERHQIVVSFLKALGISDQTAELDAEGLEHHVSEETLAAFKRYLN